MKERKKEEACEMYNMVPYRGSNLSRGLMRNFMNPFNDDFFRSFFGDERLANSFKVDVKDEGGHYLLEAELPGMNKDDLRIDVENGVMTISAETNETREENKDNYVYRERRVGSMRRSFDLEGIREEDITAEYTNGVLRLTLPKKEETTPPASHQIPIES